MTGAQEAIERILDRGGTDGRVLQEVVDALHERVDHYSWVGIYLVDGDDLVLGPWKGPEATEHVRLPVGQGVCGAAAASGDTEVVGEIDIDSDTAAAFGEEDRGFLERIAVQISSAAAGAAAVL